MDKALEIGKSSANGSFQLLIGTAGSTIIMAVGTFVLAGLLNADQVGLYGIALIPSTIIGFFRDWGINSALTQQIAGLRANGKDVQISAVIRAGIIFEIITGAVLSIVCFAIAQPLAYLLSPENMVDLTFYISIMAVSIFGGALFSAASGIFVGFEKMAFNSRTQILQAFVKTALGPLLIIIGFGVLGAIYAAVISIIVGGIVGILIAYFALFKPLSDNQPKGDTKETLKPMLRYGLPLTVSTTIIGVLPQIFAFTMAVYAGTEVMGNYYVSTYFVTLLSFVTIPVSTALFPVFSKLNPDKDLQTTQRVYAFSVKYMSMLLVPMALLLITLSTPAINLLFPQLGFIKGLFAINPAAKYPYAPLFLSLSCIVGLLALIGNNTLGTFLNGIGQTRQVMKQGIVSLCIGLPLAFFLVPYLSSVAGPSYAVVGGIVGGLAATTGNIVWGSYWGWKHYSVKADVKNSAKILLSSVLAAIAAFLFINLIPLPNVILLIGGSVIFVLIYLSVAPFIEAVNTTDINNLKTMTSNLGFVSKVLNVPLEYMLKVRGVRSRMKNS